MGGRLEGLIWFKSFSGQLEDETGGTAWKVSGGASAGGLGHGGPSGACGCFNAHFFLF